MDDSLVIAHIKQDPLGTWSEPHLLKDHLKSVAELAKDFADCFNSSSWGYALALAHDLGKSTVSWQQYIRSKSGYQQEENSPYMVDHSSPSAKVVEDLFPGLSGRILSYIIAGHHAGLPDFRGSQASLLFRLQQAVDSVTMIPPDYVELLDNLGGLVPPFTCKPDSLELSLWIRMLFSCLVDADFLDTEKYMNHEAYESRSGSSSISTLLEKYNS